MQIVINLDEEVYCDIKEGYYDNHLRSMAVAIGNGIVLPDKDEMLDNLGADEFIVVCDCCGHIMRITRRNKNAENSTSSD